MEIITLEGNPKLLMQEAIGDLTDYRLMNLMIKHKESEGRKSAEFPIFVPTIISIERNIRAPVIRKKGREMKDGIQTEKS